MKVTLVCTNDKSGGAARAMYRLHVSLLTEGIESRILCLYKSTTNMDDSIFKYDYPFLSNQRFPFLSDFIEQNRTVVSNTLFSYTDINSNISTHPLIIDADVINLHWINYFLSINDIGMLLKLNKKIFWTLHDEWAYTGGCHYTSGCNGFLNFCQNCIQVNSELESLPQMNYLEKKINYTQNIELISPSSWLAQKAKQSPLFRNNNVNVIANSLEKEWFLSLDKEKIREEFGYTSQSFIVGFGADSISEKRKGISFLIEAFEILMLNDEWKLAFESKDIVLIFFGNYPVRNISLEKYAKYLGSFGKDKEISKLYQLMDLFVIPSVEDNLPNTLLESMASGTPVLGFPVGGISEMITHNQNGFLTDSISAELLANQILQIWKDNSVRKKVGDAAYQFALSNFSSDIQAKAYCNLFRSNSDFFYSKNVLESSLMENLDSRLKTVSKIFGSSYNQYIKKSTFKKRILNFLFRSKRIHELLLLFTKIRKQKNSH